MNNEISALHLQLQCGLKAFIHIVQPTFTFNITPLAHQYLKHFSNHFLASQNEGTCFLFQCGPAQNFRCKFTHHANYTSAVLTPKRTIDPPPPKKQTQDVTVVAATPPVKSTADLGLSQHEVELSNLKEKPSRG